MLIGRFVMMLKTIGFGLQTRRKAIGKPAAAAGGVATFLSKAASAAEKPVLF